ncbi:MAG TPA: hypothetical protein VNQ73_14370 [Ilumatobacter sp.]|nr:hypothetical protein [Ilumatobacter sp.]
MSTADRDAFGYSNPQHVHEPVGVQVAEGKHANTLEPRVLIFLRWTREQPTHERDIIGLAPDQADFLADQLHQWAARAREKHWE